MRQRLNISPLFLLCRFLRASFDARFFIFIRIDGLSSYSSKNSRFKYVRTALPTPLSIFYTRQWLSDYSRVFKQL